MKDMFAQGGSGSAGIKTNKQAIARAYNVKVNEVIYSTDLVSNLNDKRVLYNKTTQMSYAVPTGLPAGAQIVSVTGNTLVYNPGAVSVSLGPVHGSAEELADIYALDAGSSMIGHKSALANAISRTIFDSLSDSVSVKDFGAVGDGVTDDTAAIQAAINACSNQNKLALSGRNLKFPGGKYRVTGEIEYIWRATDTSENDSSVNRLTISGEGDSNSFILDDRTSPGSNPLITFDGGETDPHLRLSISGLNIQRKLNDRLGWGMLFKNISITEIRSLTCNWFNTGVIFHDCIQILMDHVQIGANQLGMSASRVNWTNPNVFDLRHVMFSANNVGAVELVDAANVKFDTCTFEGNGTTKGTGQTISYSGGASEGGVGITVKNCYFENNAVESDIKIGGSTTQVTSFIIEGNSFQRTSPVRNCTRHITLTQLNPAGLHKVFIRGNTFKFLGGYTHQSGDSSVTVQSAYVKIREEGNNYVFDQLPEYAATVARGFDNNIIATGVVSATGPSLSYGHNVASVVRTATGEYTITFKEASVSGNLVATANAVGIIALTHVYGVTSNTVKIVTTNTSGTPLDTIGFSFHVTGIL